MAILDGLRKNKLLQRLSDQKWKSDAEFHELVAELGEMGLAAGEVLWTLSESSALVRNFGAEVVLAQPTPENAELLYMESRNEAPGVERFILGLLMKYPEHVVLPLLRRMLGSKETTERHRALGLFLQLPLEKILPILLELLGVEDQVVRRRVLERLLKEPQNATRPRVQEKIVALLHDPDEEIRALAFDLMAVTSGPASFEMVLERFLHEASPKIRDRAIRHLGDWSRGPLGSRIRQKLLPLLHEGDPALRQRVVQVLLNLPDRTETLRLLLRQLQLTAGWMRDRAMETLKQHKEQLIEPLAELLADPDDQVRIAALMLAIVFEDWRLLRPVMALVGDTNRWSRLMAVELLGKLRDEQALTVLLEALKEDDLRWSAASALAQIGDLRALRNLATLLSDPASEVRLEVLDALVRFNDPRVLSLLAKCASIDPSLEVRERAVRAHGAIARAHQRGAEAISLGRVDSLVDLTQLDRLSGLLVRARDQGGSDVHLKMGLRPLIRLNGKLQPLDQAEITVPQMQDLLLLALNPRQRLQFEQQLQLDFCYIVPNVGRYRANIYQDRLGVGAVFRIIPNRIPTLDELGIPPVVRRISEYRQGLVVLSGSASCGKTTTLAALVDLLNETRQSHILTLEDPIEFVHGFKNSLVDQREVGKHTQSFASALKAAMREDPDVIVVGEMRDTETLGLALNASSTGHLVVGTLHTSSAHKTVDRLIESFSPGEQQQVRLMLAESLKTVICQSLLPTADGTGRVAAFEILFHTGSLANLIRDNKTIMIPSIMQTGRAQGMRTLDDSLRELLEKKRITPEVAYARATNKEDFEPNLDGKAREAIQLVAREVGPA